MGPKKNEKVKLENYSVLFIQLGLVLVLLIVYLTFEYQIPIRNTDKLTGIENQQELIEDIPITQRLEIIKPQAPPPPIPEKIDIVEDKTDLLETVLNPTEIDQSDAVEAVEIDKIEEAVEDEVIADDVPFEVIEEAPTYPGCKGSETQKKQCLQEAINKLVTEKYNPALAGDLGLASGKKKVYVQFKIDKTGMITDVVARGPHISLEKEAIRVVNLLPQMIPGKQRGRPVGVKYTLPVTLLVE
tara:strand:+ start:414971 stop:415699 length:729 start_codon:yes stop_codon:yes gene_type:complete